MHPWEELSVWWMLLTATLTFLTVKWLLHMRWEMKHFPPGPWGLPGIGYLPWIDIKAHLSFDKLKETYGSIYSIKLGAKTNVILADWAAVKATLVDQSQIFSGRPPSHTWDVATDRSGVSFSDGPVWKNQRRLTIKCLRNVGMGRKTMEVMIMDSVQGIVEFLEKNDGQAVSMNSLFFKPLLNNVWRITASKEFVEGNEEDEAFEAVVYELMAGIRNNNPVNFFPWLRFAPPDGFGYWEFIRTNNKLWGYLRKEVDSHLAKWRSGQEMDFIDHYIGEIKLHEKPDTEPEDHLTPHHLTATLWDLFLAGVDTTNATTLWGMLFICYFPEVQVKAQEEMDRVIGRDRLPSLDDIPRLPYLDALIMEIHRYASISSLSLAHCPTETTEVLGYTIPKGTPCFQSIYGVHRDPQVWEDPHTFDPERFIDHDNKARWPPYLMPYSIGPRVCIGESLAQMELGLIFSRLLHKFRFSFPSDLPRPTLEPEMAIVMRPKPYSLLIQVRHD